MNAFDEKMKAMEVLQGACDKVTDAMNAIEAFARQYGMKVSLEKEPHHVTIAELADMVAGEIDMKPECAFAAIATAFELIEDLCLLVDVEGEDNDEE